MAAWVFQSGLLLANWTGNLVGKGAEFQADRRVVAMGFGRSCRPPSAGSSIEGVRAR
ncbi:MAG: hypothetical protein R2715_05380 [Ilumatobacteraceae bacterium]